MYFKNITAIITQEQKRALKRRRWFIGLRYFSHNGAGLAIQKPVKTRQQMTQEIGVGKVESQTTFMLSIVLRCSRAEGTTASIVEEDFPT